MLRMVSYPVLLAFGAIWLWACVAGLASGIGMAWALLVVVLAAWLRFFVLLQVAVFFGAVTVWHLPVVIALLLAAPRVFLMLPGIVSTFLANRRHPRVRWSL